MCIRDRCDTGALQSLVSSCIINEHELSFTGEKRLIRGVTGDVIAVPLVEIAVDGSLCSGTYLCGLVSTLPDGIALLVGNDMCCDETTTDVNVVTRSMTAAQAAQNDQLISQISANEQLELKKVAESVQITAGDLPDSEILTDVAPVFNENPVTIDLVNRDKLIELQ